MIACDWLDVRPLAQRWLRPLAAHSIAQYLTPTQLEPPNGAFGVEHASFDFGGCEKYALGWLWRSLSNTRRPAWPST